MPTTWISSHATWMDRSGWWLASCSVPQRVKLIRMLSSTDSRHRRWNEKAQHFTPKNMKTFMGAIWLSRRVNIFMAIYSFPSQAHWISGSIFLRSKKLFKLSMTPGLISFVTIFIGLGVIQIINRCSLVIRNIVFGHGNNTPTLNMASTFLAGYQNRVPEGNFARFILMLFIIWCLIFTTCHQSELFKHLQSDERKPPAKSFAEIIEKNLTYHGDINVLLTINKYASDKGLPRYSIYSK